MTKQEVEDFLKENEIKAGDKVFVNFDGFISSESANVEVISPVLVDGNQVIETKYGPLKLNSTGPYLLIRQYNRGNAIQGLRVDSINVIES